MPLSFSVMLDDKITLWDSAKDPGRPDLFTFGGEEHPLYKSFGRSNDPHATFEAIITGKPQNEVHYAAYCQALQDVTADLHTPLMTNLNFGDAAGQDVRGAVQYLKARGAKAGILIKSAEALEQMMSAYAGTIVFVSHDKRLVENVADIVYEIKDTKLVKIFQRE